jgi:hypothetical protein
MGRTQVDPNRSGYAFGGDREISISELIDPQIIDPQWIESSAREKRPHIPIVPFPNFQLN